MRSFMFGALCLVSVILGCSGSALERSGSATAEVPTGLLGYPLGTYLTIDGAGHEPTTKAYFGPEILVDTVNGKRLPAPIPIIVENSKDNTLSPSQRYVVKGYETGRMTGMPREVAKAEGMNDLMQIPPWQFLRTFIITSVVRPESLQLK